ncbi:MAG: 4Fe-4S dicluster domain-containing protein [Candidatus Thorarchaeota archaeon]
MTRRQQRRSLLNSSQRRGRSKVTLHFDIDACTGCMLCTKVCNFGAIEKDGDKVKFDMDLCVLCGSCEEVLRER